MGNQYYTSFPVNLIALKLSWVFTEDGKKFLEQIDNSESVQIYQTDTMKLIIEFLYKKYKEKKLVTEFPIFIMQIITFGIFSLV